MTIVTQSSGNVFKDLGFKNHEELKAKAELSRQIAVALQLSGMKQKEAEKVIGLHQGDISKIMNGHCEKFSIDRLFRILLKLGQDIHIQIHPASGRHSHLSVNGNVA